MTCERQSGLGVGVLLSVTWISLELCMKEVWHVLPLFAAREVGTNALSEDCDVRDDGSTSYPTQHGRNQGGKEFLEEKPFFPFSQLEIVLFCFAPTKIP